MKTLVYLILSRDDKTVTISKERLQEIVDEVYQSGYEDGKRDCCSTPLYIPQGYRRPSTTPTTQGGPDDGGFNNEYSK